MIITIITSKCNLNKVSILLSFSHQNFNIELSIAKGTTYPGIDCFNQIKFKLFKFQKVDSQCVTDIGRQ